LKAYKAPADKEIIEINEDSPEKPTMSAEEFERMLVI
jgi:hypothetical protein